MSPDLDRCVGWGTLDQECVTLTCRGELSISARVASAWRNLGVTLPSGIVKPLVARPIDENRNVRMMAGWSLALIGKPSVAPLTRKLQDKSSIARGDAAWSLGNIKNLKAIEPLISALSDADPELRRESHKALQQISAEDHWMDPNDWHQWWGGRKKEP